jgi:hypothetical protein
VHFGGITLDRETHVRFDDGDNHLALESREASYLHFSWRFATEHQFLWLELPKAFSTREHSPAAPSAARRTRQACHMWRLS